MAGWCTPAFLALGRLRQEDSHKLEASLNLKGRRSQKTNYVKQDGQLQPPGLVHTWFCSFTGTWLHPRTMQHCIKAEWQQLKLHCPQTLKDSPRQLGVHTTHCGSRIVSPVQWPCHDTLPEGADHRAAASSTPVGNETALGSGQTAARLRKGGRRTVRESGEARFPASSGRGADAREAIKEQASAGSSSADSRFSRLRPTLPTCVRQHQRLSIFVSLNSITLSLAWLGELKSELGMNMGCSLCFLKECTLLSPDCS